MNTDLQKLFQGNEPRSINDIAIPSDLKIMVLAPLPDDADAVGVTLKFFQRNLRTRGHGFDDRILDYNRQTARDLSLSEKYAEAFEIEIF